MVNVVVVIVIIEMIRLLPRNGVVERRTCAANRERELLLEKKRKREREKRERQEGVCKVLEEIKKQVSKKHKTPIKSGGARRFLYAYVCQDTFSNIEKGNRQTNMSNASK